MKIKIKALFIVLLTVSLNGCGVGLLSAHLVDTLVSPSSLIMTLADYKLETETGKKVSEHALSAATSKDCKLSIDVANICKDEISFDNIIVSTLKSSYTNKID